MTQLIPLSASQTPARKIVVASIGDGTSTNDTIEKIRQECRVSPEDAITLYDQLLTEIIDVVHGEQKRRGLNLAIAVTRYTAIYTAAMAKGDFRSAIAALDKLTVLQKLTGEKKMVGNRGNSPSAGGNVFNGPTQIIRNELGVENLTNEELEKLAGGSRVVKATVVPPKVLTNQSVKDFLDVNDDCNE